MIFTPVPVAGAFLVDLEPRTDPRGSFARAFCRSEFADAGISMEIRQCNLATTVNAGVVRGLHYQAAPYGEAKLMRCIRGAIYDVILDLRLESPTYKHWFGVELTADNRKALYVPEGFAHGYLTLVDDSEVFYPVSQFYTPGAERGVRWDDPAFAINWPTERILSAGGNLVLSDKDKNWPDYTR